MILAQYFHYQINSTLYPSLANFRHAIKFIMYDVHCSSQLKFPFCYKIHSRECAECYLHCQKMINGKESSPYLSFCSTKPNTVDTNDLRQRTSPQAKRHVPSLFPWLHLFGIIHSFDQACGSPPPSIHILFIFIHHHLNNHQQNSK